jgi:hypothetical protein
LGVGWLWYRLRKTAGDKLGLTRRRLPEIKLDSIRLDAIATVDAWRDADDFFAFRRHRQVTFLFDQVPTFDVAAWNLEPSWEEWSRRLDDLLVGRFVYFSDRQFEMGMPPDWFRNPYFECRAPSDRHFSELNEFQYGDVKAIWELSRFTFVYALLRIYSRTKDDRCAALFWRLVDDWCARNPGNMGINWKCGQETALRAIAVNFGVWGFRNGAGDSGRRLEQITRWMHVSGLRIEKYLQYAIRQSNNHSISEAAGLWMIGLLYPELKQAEHWKRRGQAILEQQISRLFFADGGFVQYSANYHRMAIQIITFCLALAEKNGVRFSDAAMDHFRRAVQFMRSWVDPVSGRAPRFGNDDGTLAFPLSNAAYDDYRPALQASSAIGLGQAPLPAGDWDEERVWLGQQLDRAPVVPPRREHFIGGEGGVSVLVGQRSHAVFRCGPTRHRAAQLDVFHVDLWGNGLNLAIDPGTYSYNANGKFAGIPFALSRHHNSVLINDTEPARRLGPFLFDRIPQSQLASFNVSASGRSSLLQGYRVDRVVADAEVIHRRAIAQLPGDLWLVMDQIDCRQPVRTRLHWLIDRRLEKSPSSDGWLFTNPSLQWMLQVAASTPDSETSECVGCERTPRGWFADRYLHCQPALSLEVCSPPATCPRFLSIFSSTASTAPRLFKVSFSDAEIRIVGDSLSLAIELRGESQHLVRRLEMSGATNETLAI